MRVYTKIVFDMNTCEILETESYEYKGKIVECKGGGGGSSSTTTTPPAWQQQYMPLVSEKGWGLTGTPLQYFPQSTIAGFTPEQEMAQNWTSWRATQGNPLLGEAQGYTRDVMGGKYLSPSNPLLSSLMQTGLEKVLPQATSGAQQLGRYGSGASDYLRGGAIGQVVSGIYNPERAAMEAAAGRAPMLAREDYYDIGKLAAVGEEKQAMEQAGINEAIARHEFAQLEPWQRLGMFTNLIMGDYGGTSITKTKGGGK